jgi:hypothetical protein
MIAASWSAQSEINRALHALRALASAVGRGDMSHVEGV